MNRCARSPRGRGRSPSTISRELGRNSCGAGCRATTAHVLACERASRPKPAKLAVNLVLRAKVEHDLELRYSPEQIARPLRCEFPDDAEMWVSTETIYQSLDVQARGASRHDLARCLRTGRALRRPCRQPGQRKNRVPDMINISERPAEADDRAVPEHREGDLIIGKRNLTAIGTLVERTTGFTMLLHLPDGYKPEQARNALAAKIQTLPQHLRGSLTWDQGPEMRDWKSVSIAADIEIFSVTRTPPGSARPTKTPTACCASTSPKAPTSRSDRRRPRCRRRPAHDLPRKHLRYAKPIEEIGPLLLR